MEEADQDFGHYQEKVFLSNMEININNNNSLHKIHSPEYQNNGIKNPILICNEDHRFIADHKGDKYQTNWNFA